MTAWPEKAPTAVATLRIGPEAVVATCTLSTMVTEPPRGRSALTSGEPVPEATSHTPPAAPTHVQESAFRPAGTGSDTATSFSVAGPKLLATIVYENVSPGSAVETLAVFCNNSFGADTERVVDALCKVATAA